MEPSVSGCPKLPEAARGCSRLGTRPPAAARWRGVARQEAPPSTASPQRGWPRGVQGQRARRLSACAASRPARASRGRSTLRCAILRTRRSSTAASSALRASPRRRTNRRSITTRPSWGSRAWAPSAMPTPRPPGHPCRPIRHPRRSSAIDHRSTLRPRSHCRLLLTRARRPPQVRAASSTGSG